MLFPCWRLFFSILICFNIPCCAATPGNLTTFTDEECSPESVDNPDELLQVNGCCVTHGAIGIAIESYPSCSSGKPILFVYQDTSCTKPFANNIVQNDNCFSVGSNRIFAVKVLCESPTGDSVTTTTSSTTTRTPGDSAGTASPSSSKTTATTTFSASGTSSCTPTNSPDGSSCNGGSHGLSRTAQILLGLLVPALVALIVGLLRWLFPHPFSRKKRPDANRLPLSASAQKLFRSTSPHNVLPVPLLQHGAYPLPQRLQAPLPPVRE